MTASDRARIHAYRVVRRMIGEMAGGFIIHPTHEKREALHAAMAVLLEGISEADRRCFNLTLGENPHSSLS